MNLSSIEEQKQILDITNNNKATNNDKIRSRHHAAVVDSSSSLSYPNEKTNLEISKK